MNALQTLLSRLQKVKGRRDSWTACCPAHADRSPSLAIRLLDDGRILLHCFADCAVQDVLGAVGMDISDLFPPDEKRQLYDDPMKPIKPAFFATDLMRIIHFESTILQIAAFDIAEGKALKEVDRQRVKVAHERITEAMRYGNV